MKTSPASPESADVLIIGAGIVGLANALALARRGLSVTVLERGSRAMGASIRNFGMVWPIGQPAGTAFAQARRSRDLWTALAAEAGFFLRETGSLHLAHRQDEAAVLEEFAKLAPSLDVPVTLWSAAETASRSPAANPEGLRCALWSGTEACVDPREAMSRIPEHLARRYGVTFHFDTAAQRIEEDTVLTNDGRRWKAPRIVVSTGEDFRQFFPEAFAGSGIRRCKLQMLRTVPQPDGWKLGPMIASGLTLRHYAIFDICQSLAVLKARIAAETPELDRFGIHVMASQHRHGEVVLGDSHEYDREISPFDREEIDGLILRELRKILRLPTWDIAERWHGIYAKHPTLSECITEPRPGVTVMNAIGGAGMTRSFAVAEDHWSARL